MDEEPEMKQFIKEKKYTNKVKEYKIKDNMDIQEAKEKFQKDLGDQYKVESVEDENKLKIYKKERWINPGKKYYGADDGRAEEIIEVEDDYIHYKSSREKDNDGKPQEYIISKKKTDKPEKYKIYDYTDGKMVFIDDERKPVEEVK